MNPTDIRAGVIEAIRAIAPEVEEGELLADRPLRSQVDLDSMDWLNVIVGLHERFGVDIAESDYAKLTTLDAIVAYLADRMRDGPSEGDR
ncbi:MAG: acyl carrier protein [Caldimonas sp.]